VRLSSDFITGFCGETDAEHADTVDLMRRVQYDMAFMFAYSMREVRPPPLPPSALTPLLLSPGPARPDVLLCHQLSRHCLAFADACPLVAGQMVTSYEDNPGHFLSADRIKVPNVLSTAWQKTHAHRRYVDDVPEEVKKARLEEIIGVFRAGAANRNAQLVGTTQLVLLEGVRRLAACPYLGWDGRPRGPSCTVPIYRHVTCPFFAGRRGGGAASNWSAARTVTRAS
jgi:hypothetical protein